MGLVFRCASWTLALFKTKTLGVVSLPRQVLGDGSLSKLGKLHGIGDRPSQWQIVCLKGKFPAVT